MLLNINIRQLALNFGSTIQYHSQYRFPAGKNQPEDDVNGEVLGDEMPDIPQLTIIVMRGNLCKKGGSQWQQTSQ